MSHTLTGNADTDQYFRRGNCNQHAVGLCLMLEKTRSLSHSWVTLLTFLHL